MSMSTDQRLMEMERRLERIEKLLAKIAIDQKLPDSQWMTESQAMKTLNLGKKSLQLLRKKSVLRYSTASGKNIKYWRKDVDQYLMDNSNLKIKSPT